MSKCRFCDHDNPANSDRCQSCGASLSAKLAPPAADAESTAAEPSADAAPTPDRFETQILDLLKGGRKIEAIKLYRNQTGQGLKEAKEAVEVLAVKHGVNPKGAGCAGVVLLMVLLGATAWAFLA